MGPANARPTDEGEWSAVERRTLLGAVKPGDPFRQLGVYANMQGDCRKQLDHVRKRVNPGITCMAARWKTEFAGVPLVSSAVVLKQAGYGLQFTTILEAGITNLMGKSRQVALRAAHAASTEPRDLTGASSGLHGLGLINWHTANTANKVAILHQMLNGLDSDLASMVTPKYGWGASRRAPQDRLAEPPCCPSTTKWWG